jgi:hypothetical protein
LVVAIKVNFVGGVPEGFTFLQFFSDVRIACGGDEGREEVQPRHNAILDLSGRDVARPADDHRHTHAAFHDRPLAGGEGRVAAIGPGEVLGAVVGREHDDRVVLESLGLQLGQHAAHDIVELRHDAFFQIPTIVASQFGSVFR